MTSEDDLKLIDIVVNTLNSDHKNRFAYYNSNLDILPDEIYNIFKANNAVPPETIRGESIIRSRVGGIRVGDIVSNRGGASTTKIKASRRNPTGSFSLMNRIHKHYNGAQTAFHEIFGHGRPLSLSRDSELLTHRDAIKLENLVLRVMGLSNRQRNGSTHGRFGTIIPDNTSLPEFD